MTTNRKSRYVELLRDPRWQRRRLEIYERDDFTCQFCLAKEITLNVHHRWYVADAKPWEYPDIALVTLCENCHREETFLWQGAARALLRALQRSGMPAAGVAVMAAAFNSRQLTIDEAQGIAHRVADVVSPRPTEISMNVKGGG